VAPPLGKRGEEKESERKKGNKGKAKRGKRGRKKRKRQKRKKVRRDVETKRRGIIARNGELGSSLLTNKNCNIQQPHDLKAVV